MHDVNPYRHGLARQSDSLADILDRVLDKGLVIAGDVRINLLDIELLTLKIRLLIASADKAREMGIDWWAHDPHLSSQARERHDQTRNLQQENTALQQRIERLEAQLEDVMQQIPAVSAAEGVESD